MAADSFLVPVTLMMHNFWATRDATTFQIEQVMFMKNLTMIGGALLISYFGAGPLSLDALINPERELIDRFTSDRDRRTKHES